VDVVLYCIVFEHLYSAFSQHEALQKRFSVRLVPRKPHDYLLDYLHTHSLEVIIGCTKTL